MTRPYNFSAGPAVMPEEVLAEAASEMLDWHGSGMSVREMSHRGREFMSIYAHAEADLRELLSIPSRFKILFMQGGGIAENAIVPLNLSQGGVADFIVTGSWSVKSQMEAKRYCDARIAATNKPDGHTSLPPPASWNLSEDAAYVHVCSNETINGVEFQELPDLAALGSKAALVIDCSSHIASRPIDWTRVGLAFGGAQKNLGPAGLTVVIVREDLLGHAMAHCPSAFDYKTVADNESMYNTPPTYAIYVAGLVFKWLKRFEFDGATGLAAIERRNIAKAELLYRYLDGSGYYINQVSPDCRSRMNVPFFLPSDSLYETFLAGAKSRGLLQLKGHKSVGGLRASIYNAMPLEGVQALVSYLDGFASSHG
ncbi:MAG: phosphoserine aminotransferase apoenzyme [Rhizobacter sp.]|nr:phosphoserine aminotransferase apoenzyme [Rhizobacter sp.]